MYGIADPHKLAICHRLALVAELVTLQRGGNPARVAAQGGDGAHGAANGVVGLHCVVVLVGIGAGSAKP
jgi:hypothetical protein